MSVSPRDLRRVLRATPPPLKSGRMVQVYLTPDQYERLYFMAHDAQLSLSDMLRTLIEKEPDHD